MASIATHTKWVNFYGTLFRGLSLGSILLVVAIGLAITFGLMGVINMAHGELIAVGAYTTYVVQNLFGTGLALSPFGLKIALPGMQLQGAALDGYFIVALPLSFLVAAGVGILLERGVIHFLYRRPLESLLATWGVSLVLQQLFRLTFGANNVQVYSPAWLSGHWTLFDVILGWNRAVRHRLCGRDHRGDLGASDEDSVGLAHPSRDAESADGCVHGCAHGAGKYADLRLRKRVGGTRWGVSKSNRQRRPLAGPELHRRCVHDGRRWRSR